MSSRELQFYTSGGMRTWRMSESDLSESARFSSPSVCGLQAGRQDGIHRAVLVRSERLNQEEGGGASVRCVTAASRGIMGHETGLTRRN